jgi:hypothetical protein
LNRLGVLMMQQGVMPEILAGATAIVFDASWGERG